MQYLVIPKNQTPFFTKWVDSEKFPSEGGTAINLITDEFTTDGKIWHKVERDHL